MPEAAHQTHQVAHSLGMAGLIAGAVVGGILAVGITVATGGAGAVVIASAVATGVSAGGGLGKMIGSHFSGMPSGPIMLNCATNVLIEGLPAATVGSLTMCTGGMIGPPHPSSPIVQGSSTVFINGKPAARKGDKLACSASVNEGCATVIIGGETITVGPLNPEIPEWVDWGLMGLGMLGGYGLLRAGGMGVMAAAARIGGATAGGMGGSMLGGWGAQQLGYQPGSWGHDLASLGGGLLGGWAGYKGGERLVPGAKTQSGLTTPQGLTNEQFATASQKVRTRASELGYGDDIVVQGSRAKGTARTDSDIDIGIRVSEERFNQILDERFGTPNPGSAKERTLNQARETGKIQRGEAGMRGVGRELENDLGMDVDISVIRIDGPFDTPPFVPLN